MKKTTQFAVIAAAIATVVLMLVYVEAFEWGLVAFLLFGLSPYLLIYFLLGRLEEGLPARFFAVVSWVLIIMGAAFYIQAFWIAPSAQSGLVFITVPVYQWAFLIPALLILLFLRKKRA